MSENRPRRHAPIQQIGLPQRDRMSQRDTEPTSQTPLADVSAAVGHGAPHLGGVYDAVQRNEAFQTCLHEGLAEEEMVVDVRDFNLFYGAKQALYSIAMGVPHGKVTALIGPSGCGKSTLLRSVNRMNDLIDSVRTQGEMFLSGDAIFGSNVDVIELRKRIGMVFQKPNPFPMSIFENVVYSLRIDGVTERNVLEETCETSLRRSGLWEETKDRLQESALRLSGGQQQRLCLARALALDPDVLLMDEPCSALDPIASGVVEDLVASLRGQYTVVIVTHNLAQARRLADHVAVFWLQDGAGMLIEHGPVAATFEAPRHELTAAYVRGIRG
jgi:phosphate transport system ATP-binding protein